ncbi:MAG: hypothetical protein GEU76_16800 [Alphaproteobacteria bacterium]|nr:hypothetical protein [Alphaproteobacteria bacterium]
MGRGGLARFVAPLAEAVPLRFVALRALDRRLNFLSYASKLNYGVVERPHYGHCLLQAALIARKLGYPAITAIEFGVAGGNGLVALERHAEHVEREVGIAVALYGFDSGSGMPDPVDYRDMPYLWQPGYFKMDVDALRTRLSRAELRLGPVEETLPRFLREESPPPIGFIAFDLDYYSSTMAALRIFDAELSRFLPRVACYLDDMVGDIAYAYNEFTGELLALKEFNASHERAKIVPVNGIRFYGGRIPRLWHEQIFAAHLFDHPDYNRPISDLAQLPLREGEGNRPSQKAKPGLIWPRRPRRPRRAV